MKYTGSSRSDNETIEDRFLPYRAFPVCDRIRLAGSMACRPEISAYELSVGDETLKGKGSASKSEVEAWVERAIASGKKTMSLSYYLAQDLVKLRFTAHGEIILEHGLKDRRGYLSLMSQLESEFRSSTGTISCD